MKSICVYCGSSPGNAGYYQAGARAMARELVQQGISLVYGGGHVGLMGIIADEVLRLGGSVTGVIPDALMQREVGHAGLMLHDPDPAALLEKMRAPGPEAKTKWLDRASAGKIAP